MTHGPIVQAYRGRQYVPLDHHAHGPPRVSGSDAAGRPPQTAPSHSDNDHARPPHAPPTVAIPGLARSLQHVSQITAAINWSAYIDERHTDRRRKREYQACGAGCCCCWDDGDGREGRRRERARAERGWTVPTRSRVWRCVCVPRHGRSAKNARRTALPPVFALPGRLHAITSCFDAPQFEEPCHVRVLRTPAAARNKPQGY